MQNNNSQALFFEHVANKDYEGLSRLYAFQARNAILSFLAMRHRWNNNGSSGAPHAHRFGTYRRKNLKDKKPDKRAEQRCTKPFP
jgi:hypothetical protein